MNTNQNIPFSEAEKKLHDYCIKAATYISKRAPFLAWEESIYSSFWCHLICDFINLYFPQATVADGLYLYRVEHSWFETKRVVIDISPPFARSTPIMYMKTPETHDFQDDFHFEKSIVSLLSKPEAQRRIPPLFIRTGITQQEHFKKLRDTDLYDSLFSQLKEKTGEHMEVLAKNIKLYDINWTELNGKD